MYILGMHLNVASSALRNVPSNVLHKCTHPVFQGSRPSLVCHPAHFCPGRRQARARRAAHRGHPALAALPDQKCSFEYVLGQSWLIILINQCNDNANEVQRKKRHCHPKIQIPLVGLRISDIKFIKCGRWALDYTVTTSLLYSLLHLHYIRYFIFIIFITSSSVLTLTWYSRFPLGPSWSYRPQGPSVPRGTLRTRPSGSATLSLQPGNSGIPRGPLGALLPGRAVLLRGGAEVLNGLQLICWKIFKFKFLFVKHLKHLFFSSTQCILSFWQQHCKVQRPKNLTLWLDSNPGSSIL
jgi:hypothetical protein